jgi:hypothetical protein
MKSYHLTEAQKASFHNDGYIIGLPAIYTGDEIQAISIEEAGTQAEQKPR